MEHTENRKKQPGSADIDGWLLTHEQEMVQDIAALVRIRSVACEGSGTSPFGSGCRRALDEMLRLGIKYGLDVSDCDGYAGEICWGRGRRSVGVWGHLDVVPEGDGWEYPPYELTRMGDLLIGRGAQDNKGPLIAVLYALRYLKDGGWMPEKRFRLIFGCQEESGMGDVEYFLAHREAPELSFVADCGFPVCRGEKGILHLEFQKKLNGGMIREMEGGTAPNIVPDWARARVEYGGISTDIQARGIPGHAAFPEGTENAVGTLCRKLLELPLEEEERKWILFLEKVCRDGFGRGAGLACQDRESGPLTCNTGVVAMKEGICRVILDIRYPVTVRGERLLAIVEEAARQQDFTVRVLQSEKPYFFPEEHPLVASLMDAYRQEKQDGKLPYVMGGGTYAKKIPGAVGFGPGMDQHLERLGFSGTRGQCHSADEAQSLENLKLAVKIYIRAFLALEKL